MYLSIFIQRGAGAIPWSDRRLKATLLTCGRTGQISRKTDPLTRKRLHRDTIVGLRELHAPRYFTAVEAVITL